MATKQGVSHQQAPSFSRHGTPFSDPQTTQFFSSSTTSLTPNSNPDKLQPGSTDSPGSSSNANGQSRADGSSGHSVGESGLVGSDASAGRELTPETKDDGMEWSNFTNLQDIQHLQDIITQQDGSGVSQLSSTELLNAYTSFSQSTPNFGQYINSDIIQGGYANTANPPIDAAAMTKTGSHSITSEDYTPLISPAVTPLERTSSSSTFNGVGKKPGFSPLTSPALEFQRYHSSGGNGAIRQKRKDKATTASPQDQSRGYKRSKTPNTTPLMRPMNNSSTASRRRPSASYQKKYRQSAQVSQQQSSQNDQNIFDGLPDDLMLPPAQDNSAVDDDGQLQPDGAPVATPATLMSFPISATISRRNSPRLSANDNVLANPHHDLHSAHSSPVILPSSSSSIYLQQHQAHQLRRMNSRDSSNGSSSLRTSPHIEHQQPEESVARRGSGSSQTSSSNKKVNHKLAEQGRRNRMNVAIQELDELIPDYFKDESMVPSKATTVELSSKYIRQLQDECDAVKKEVDSLKSQLERFKGVPTTESGSSISPLEFTEVKKDS